MERIAAMKALDLTPYLLESGKVQSYAWPGGYPIYFVSADSGVLCPDCVNNERGLIDAAAADEDKQWLIVATDINWEDGDLYCDHCNKRIESAYGDDEDDENTIEDKMDEVRKNLTL